MLVILWTDALLWLLVMAGIVYGWRVRRHAHLRAPWARVGQSATALFCTVILGSYLLVALLDSVHFRPQLPGAGPGPAVHYAVDVRSLLDIGLARLLEARERSYSAPLALTAFTKESTDNPQGGTARDYPALQYAGRALHGPGERWPDLGRRALVGATGGLVLGLSFSVLVAALGLGGHPGGLRGRLRALWAGQTEVRWRAACLGACLVLVVAGVVYSWSLDYHVLGTDKVGRDVLYASLKGIRTALVIGTLTTFVMLPFALVLGMAAGYFRGWVDDLVQYAYTVLNSIPGVLLIAASVLLVQVKLEQHPDLFPTTAQRADVRLLSLCLILGITSWTALARLLRGETLKLREAEFVQAAQTFGVPGWRIIASHVTRNVMHLAVISLVMDFSGLVLAEAVLSYIGVGVDPTMYSFGTMINAARLELSREPMVWWSLAAAFGFMLVLVLAANLFADAVRDAFDPRTVLSPGRPPMRPPAPRAAQRAADGEAAGGHP
jgi:peptide/nickel transport system permease protein